MMGQGKRTRRRFRSAQLVIKSKGRVWREWRNSQTIGEDRGYQGVRFAPPSCNRRFRSVRYTSSDSFELAHGHRATLRPSSGLVALKFGCQEKARERVRETVERLSAPSRQSQVRSRLAAGGRWIRTIERK